MASQITKVDQYKLDSRFLDDTVVHTTILVSGERMRVREMTWKREKKLGAGGFGTVWREKEQLTGRFRAVKVVSKIQLNVRELEALIELQDVSKSVDSFTLLPKLTSSKKPNYFILFLGWFEDPHAAYIAMEYAEHGDLAHYLDNNAEKALYEVKDITRQILTGLVVMHQRDICHRDLKPQVRSKSGAPPATQRHSQILLTFPENILVMSPSPIWVKITDFGIAKQTSQTSLRTACGTSCYQAPEVLGLLPRSMRTSGSNSYSKTVDIWALGAVVHKILTFEIPFLDKYEDSTISGLDSAYATSAEVDIGLLSDYCRKSQPFPTESLLTHGASKYAIDFVKSMMVADPRRRVSAAAALDSDWLRGTEPSSHLLVISLLLFIHSSLLVYC